MKAKTESEKQDNDFDDNTPIRMPSEGYRFKLNGTVFEVIKSKGMKFTAQVDR